jgi:hypothetical protein
VFTTDVNIFQNSWCHAERPLPTQHAGVSSYILPARFQNLISIPHFTASSEFSSHTKAVPQAMVYDTQNCSGFGICPPSGTLNIREHNISESRYLPPHMRTERGPVFSFRSVVLFSFEFPKRYVLYSSVSEAVCSLVFSFRSGVFFILQFPKLCVLYSSVSEALCSLVFSFWSVLLFSLQFLKRCVV